MSDNIIENTIENTIENIVINKPMSKAIVTNQKSVKEVDYTNTCSICNNDYNKSNYKKITCYCNVEFCKTCIKTYILSKNEIAHCFNCNISFACISISVA